MGTQDKSPENDYSSQANMHHISGTILLVCFNAMVTISPHINLSHGYLWWLNGKPSHMLPSTQLVFPGNLTPPAPNDMLAALGKNGRIISIVPCLGLVVVRVGGVPDNSLVPMTLNNQIWERLARVITPSTSSDVYTVHAGGTVETKRMILVKVTPSTPACFG